MRIAAVMAGMFLCAGVVNTQAGDPGDPTGAFGSIQGTRRVLLLSIAPQQTDARRLFLSLGIAERTTYDAITHALDRTKLTSDDGKPMGSVLGLISRITRIAGEDERRRNDEQFRLYVEMKPGARQVLAHSKEFYRECDNWLFHRGYPISYRQRGRLPNIQVSLSRDGQRADIDIDYRSSMFPLNLFNGHFAASNSDVRAGSNYQRHNRRWTGLIDWWRELFRIQPPQAMAFTHARVVPSYPTVGIAPTDLTDSINAFLNKWLVQRRLSAARRYLIPDLQSCTADRDEAGEERTPAPKDQFGNLLYEATQQLPRVIRTNSVVEAVAPWDESLRLLSHDRQDQYTVVELSSEESREALCHREVAAESGPSYRVILRFKTQGQPGPALALLWRQERGRWMIAGFDVLDS